jgi:hypothetical protein
MTDLVVGKVSTEGSGNLTIDVGTASALITAGDHNVEIIGDRTESTGAAKAVITAGGRGVEVTGSMTQKVAGAILAKIGGDMADTAATMFTEVAAGAHILKADTVVFEGETIVSFVDIHRWSEHQDRRRSRGDRGADPGQLRGRSWPSGRSPAASAPRRWRPTRSSHSAPSSAWAGPPRLMSPSSSPSTSILKR